MLIWWHWDVFNVSCNFKCKRLHILRCAFLPSQVYLVFPKAASSIKTEPLQLFQLSSFVEPWWYSGSSRRKQLSVILWLSFSILVSLCLWTTTFTVFLYRLFFCRWERKARRKAGIREIHFYQGTKAQDVWFLESRTLLWRTLPTYFTMVIFLSSC